LKARRFGPLPVRERLIPKPGSGKLRMLGIPTGTAYCAVALVL
jgi:RNA-directed DNA polymerase